MASTEEETDYQSSANEDNEDLGEEIDGDQSDFQKVSMTGKSVPMYARPPWPEWSDDAINNETWEENESTTDGFEDITGYVLPPSIRPAHWVRPKHLNLNPKMVDLDAKTIDLVSPNVHLCQISEAIRFIISEISELYDQAKSDDFVCEGEGVIFTRNGMGSWAPWDHIYSLCKAGVKGDLPSYNPNGRYIVRLYYMGCWRKITVDDRIPILRDGSVGLPIGQNSELWPLILTKALLKVASLTSDDLHGIEVKQFSAMSCLTGWTHEWHDVVAPISADDLWRDLKSFLPMHVAPTDHLDVLGGKVVDESDPFWQLPPADSEGPDFDEFGEPLSARQNPEGIVSPESQLRSGDNNNEPADDEERKKGGKKKKSKKDKGEDDEVKGKGKQKKKKGISEDEVLTEDDKSKKKKSRKDVEMRVVGKDKKNTIINVDDIKDGLKEKDKPAGDDANGNSEQTGNDGKQKGKKAKKGQGEPEEADDGVKPKKKKKSKSTEEDKSDEADAKSKKKKKQKTDNEGNMEDEETKPKKKKKKQGEVENADETEDAGKGNKKKKGSKRRETDQTTENDLDIEPSDDEVDGLRGRRQKRRREKRERTPKSKERPPETLTKEELKEKLAQRAKRTEQVERHRNHNVGNQSRRKSSESPRVKIPSMQEILLGVQQYSTGIYHVLIKAFEEMSGKDIPIAFTVIFDEFPKESESSYQLVPSNMHHPVQLFEVRDFPLEKSGPLKLPLWKTYRWKAWAMKKGLIPMELELFKKDIRSVMAHTPFALKKDWFKSAGGNGDEMYGEYFGECYDYDDGEFEGEGEEEEEKEDVKPIVSNTQSMLSLIAAGANEERRETKSSRTYSKKRRSKKNIPKTAEEEGSQLDVGNRKPTVYNEEAAGEGELEHGDFVRTPENACATLWFDVASIAPNIRKFCKFYSGRTAFGSCFILRRSPRWVFETPVLKGDLEPTRPVEITNFHSNPYSRNLTINFGESKTIHVMSHHLDDIDGFDSGFFLFSDSWTEQELIFDLEVLQLTVLKKFIHTSLQIPKSPIQPDPTAEDEIAVLQKLQTPKVNITLILEPWDWRNDCCIEAPIVCATTQTKWTTHLPLPPGRNTFRIWLIQDFPEISTAGFSKFRKLESVRRVMDSQKRNEITQFSLKVMSRTPINIGSREEIQNYLTNEPVLFLKQCERLTHSIWTLLLSFGKSPYAFAKAMTNVRKCYCPSYTELNDINKVLKPVHASFDEYFVAMFRAWNDDEMDHWLLLALRCLLLNPTVGYVHDKSTPIGPVSDAFRELALEYKKAHKLSLVKRACLVIQRFYRGWKVRRLFKARSKDYKHFRRLEFQMRRLALSIAFHTDSTFSVAQDKTLHDDQIPTPSEGEENENETNESNENEMEEIPLTTASEEDEETSRPNSEPTTALEEPAVTEVPEIPYPPPLSIIPQPPKWSVDLLRYLMQVHPMLMTLLPHAYCVPHHVKIKDIEGTLPSFSKDSEWLPFCRQPICVPNELKWTYCEFDLQVNPRDGIIMKVVDNSTTTVMPTVNNTHYLGRLPASPHGYTIVCYRWATSKETRPDAFRRPPSKNWKLRIISPQIQNSIELRDPSEEEEKELPKKLCLNRFTGYYFPNHEHCVCRYTVETRQLVTYLSIRFQASNPTVQLSIEILDINQNILVFQHDATGGFLLPSVRIEGLPLSTGEEGFEHSSDKSAESIQSVYTQSAIMSSTDFLDNGDPSFMTLPTPSQSSIHPPPQRYLICIYASDGSWKLTAPQWKFTQSEKKRFWKRLMITKKVPSFSKGKTVRVTQPPKKAKKKIKKSAKKVEEEEHEEEEEMEAEADDAQPQEKTPKKGKRRGKGKDAKHKNKGEKENDKNKDKRRGSASSPGKKKKHGVSPSIIDLPPNNGPTPPTENESPFPNEEAPTQKVATPLEDYPSDGYETANLFVKLGGPQSVEIKDPSQQHWTLEIVTDMDQEIDIFSNMRLLHDNLMKSRGEWENKQNEMLAEGLGTRVPTFADPGAYMLANPFTLIQLIRAMEFSLYLDESQMNKFTYGELVTPAEARARVMEKQLAEQAAASAERSSHLQKTGKTKAEKGKHGTRAPPNTPVPPSTVEEEEARKGSIKGDLFPAKNAGSDFDFSKIHEPFSYSIFPVDLSTGSPSFLELMRRVESPSAPPEYSEMSRHEETEGEGFDYENSQMRWRLLNEYMGEAGESYDGMMEGYYGNRKISAETKSTGSRKRSKINAPNSATTKSSGKTRSRKGKEGKSADGNSDSTRRKKSKNPKAESTK